jgi:translation initiation factor IF-3
MEVTGKIKKIDETKTFGNNGFRKRELVVTTEEQYPQMILIEFIQDKCDLLNNFKEGDDVKVSINLRGREWVNPQGETKYFNSITGWRIENVMATGSNVPPAAMESFQPADKVSDDEPDDLPF